MSIPAVDHRVRSLAALSMLLTVSGPTWIGTGAVASPQDSLFGSDTIVSIDLELGPNGMRKLELAPRSYVPAVVRINGEGFEAEVHLKGHGSFEPIMQKPNFMVRLEKGSKAKKRFGQKRLLLDNSSQDRSFIRWKLASELFLKAELPAARINFAQVTLNQRDLGLYVLVEPTDKPFLVRSFGSPTGNLYEGSNMDVEDKLDLDSGDPSNAQRDLQALASACHQANPQRRWDRLRQTLDVERFASFMALEVLVCHHDGYSLDRNNFRIYHDPRANRMVFIPHGMDLIFKPPTLPLDGDWRGTVARSFMETEQGRQVYRVRLADLAKMVYGSDDLDRRITALSDFLRAHLPKLGSGFRAAISELREEVRQRREFVLGQLGPHAPTQ
jgi:spore coat protein H